MSAVSAGRTTRLLGAGTANLSRLTLATCLLALWAHTGGQGLTGVGLPWLILSGLVGFGLGDLALYGAYYRIGPRLGVLLCLCLAAPFGAVVEWVWLGTHLTAYQIFWSATILVGVFAALAPDSPDAGARPHMAHRESSSASSPPSDKASGRCSRERPSTWPDTRASTSTAAPPPTSESSAACC